MSWLFSQALVEATLGGGFLGGEPCAQLNVMPTQHKFWRNDKTMEFSQLSRFGLTLRLLTDADGEALLTSYLADFHVKTLALQEGAQELKASVAECGKSLPGSFAKYDQAKSLWKIAQHSLFEDLELSLVTWPRWGSMQNGECYQHVKLAQFTCENASGFLLPTIGANEGKGASKDRYLHSKAFRGAKMCEGLRTCETDPIYLNPSFAELTMMWPLGWTDLNPLAMDKFQEWQQQHSFNLQQEQEFSEVAA
jgi:hypothetical protein